MIKYAALVKHFARDISDVRIEIVNVPREIEDVGPHEVFNFVRKNLLGPFEVIAVTDRIYEREYKPTATVDEEG